MPITANESGTLYEQKVIILNEGGTLYELDTVHSNEGGTLYEIHGKRYPKMLTWHAEQQTVATFVQAKINSQSDDGMSINATMECGGIDVANQSELYTDAFFAKAGTVIKCTTSDVSGTGTVKSTSVYIGTGTPPANGNNATELSSEYTIPADGEYHLIVTGYSYTTTGSSSGTSTTQYPITATFTFEFN